MPERVNLLLTASTTQEIDLLQADYIFRLNTVPEIRIALYEVARQNAWYRRSLAPAEPLPTVDLFMLPLTDIPDLLKQTHDTDLVDRIELFTERRLKRLPDLRTALFDMARLGIAYRAAAQGETIEQ